MFPQGNLCLVAELVMPANRTESPSHPHCDTMVVPGAGRAWSAFGNIARRRSSISERQKNYTCAPAAVPATATTKDIRAWSKTRVSMQFRWQLAEILLLQKRIQAKIWTFPIQKRNEKLNHQDLSLAAVESFAIWICARVRCLHSWYLRLLLVLSVAFVLLFADLQSVLFVEFESILECWFPETWMCVLWQQNWIWKERYCSWTRTSGMDSTW